MGVFKEMDPEVALAAIQGYQDELTSPYAAQEQFYAGFRCPRCRCPLQKEFDARTAFNSETVIAKALLRCENCRYLIDPHTNVIIETGNAAKIPLQVIPLLKKEEDD